MGMPGDNVHKETISNTSCSFLLKLKHLEYLDLSVRPELTDPCIAELMKFECLKVLRLLCCKNISTAAVENLAKGVLEANKITQIIVDNQQIPSGNKEQLPNLSPCSPEFMPPTDFQESEDLIALLHKVKL